MRSPENGGTKSAPTLLIHDVARVVRKRRSRIISHPRARNSRRNSSASVSDGMPMASLNDTYIRVDHFNGGGSVSGLWRQEWHRYLKTVSVLFHGPE